VYVEPYGGAASVLLRKPRSYGEIYNDLYGELVAVFRVLRDRDQAAELERLLRLTPFAREEFEGAYAPTDDAVEGARRTIIRSFMGFGSAATYNGHATGFRCNSNRNGTTPAHDWVNWPNQVRAFTERLQGVVIESRPAVDVVRQHDAPGTLHYVDPPYPHGTRTHKVRATGQVYAFELTDDDHRALASVLRRVSGLVVLSGYSCDLYDQELYSDWHRVTCRALADGAQARTEVLWLSPRTWDALAGRQERLEI
jgi:DNA adenine methylase